MVMQTEEPLVSAEDVRLIFPTFLTDEALETLINASIADIEAFTGATTENKIVPLYLASNYVTTLFPLQSLVSVKAPKSGTDRTLVVLKIDGGMNDREVDIVSNRIYKKVGYFYPGVEVVYVPRVNEHQKKQAVIDLVKLYASYSPDRVERTGDISISQKDFHYERSMILNRISASNYNSMFA